MNFSFTPTKDFSQFWITPVNIHYQLALFIDDLVIVENCPGPYVYLQNVTFKGTGTDQGSTIMAGSNVTAGIVGPVVIALRS